MTPAEARELHYLQKDNKTLHYRLEATEMAFRQCRKENKELRDQLELASTQIRRRRFRWLI